MIYFSLGLPGRLSQWCDAVIEQLAARGGRPAATMRFPDGGDSDYPLLDRAALTMIRTRASHLVIGTRQPDQKLKNILLDADRPFVLALDDPRTVVAHLHAAGQHDVPALTRNVANNCPALMDYAALPGAYIVRTGAVADDAAAVVLAVAQHLGIEVSPGAAGDIAAALADGLGQDPGAGAIAGLSAEENQMVEGALSGYAAHFRGEPFGDLIWTRQLFFRASDPEAKLHDPINLRDTGNGRFLIYGPYMGLPPGYWSAQIVLGISPEGAGQTLTIDAFSGHQLAVAKFSARMGGVFTTGIEFAIDVASSQNIEIRILVGRDSAPGQLAFGHVLLHPISIQHATNVAREQDDFRTALEL